MYQSRGDSDDYLHGGAGANAIATLALDQVVPASDAPRPALKARLGAHLAKLDLAPDLGADIGSKRWFRGLGTMIALGAASFSLWPGFEPVMAAPPPGYGAGAQDIYRSQSIAPLALGGDSGQRMGPTRAVSMLAAAPERPSISVLGTLARGDTLDRMLTRAGLSRADIGSVMGLVGGAVAASDIAPGTKIDITLGRRPDAGAPRPLESLAFRARFDLELEIGRGEDGGPLAMTQRHIRVDDTPLRIRGTVGDSLYRSARAAGAPASAVQAYLRAIGDQADLSSALRPDDTFDIIVQQRRAATGERQAGQLLYAGIDRGQKPKMQLMRWGRDGNFYEASGVGEQRNGLMAPVPGGIGSRFGLRRHPILGYTRMHAGLDFHAAYGQPIVAVADAVVLSAGRAGGCGNAVKLNHGSGLQTRYCHMSRMAVSPGQSIRRGQVIGYVGSTGLSTGAHLHYEMYRNGRAVDPQSVQYVTRAQLAGADLAAFRSALATLKTVEPGAALADLEPTPSETRDEAPSREIDRLEDKPQRR